MVVRIFVFLFVISCLVSCKPKEESKGDEIPTAKIFSNPLDLEKQIVYLSSLIDENPQPQLLFYRARAYFLTHQYHFAKIDLDQLFNKTNEINDEYILLNAWLNVRLGNLDKAQELLNLSNFSRYKATDNLPIFFELYVNKRLFTAATSTFNLMKKDNLKLSDEFSTIAKSILTADSTQLPSYFSKHRINDYQNDFVAKAYLKFALNSASPLDYQKVCLDLLKHYPFDSFYLINWAKFLVKMKKNDQAEKVFNKAVQLLPENSNFYFDFGEFYYLNHNYSRAYFFLDHLTHENIKFAEAQYIKACCLFFQGKKNEAKKIMDDFGKRYPKQQGLVTKFYKNYFFKSDSTTFEPDTLLQVNQ